MSKLPGRTGLSPCSNQGRKIARDDRRKSRFPWLLLLSELAGTASLLLVGLSVVILMFGRGSPIEYAFGSGWLRRTITGFLFGSVGALIVLSPVGKISGAHINPVVTLGFWLTGKLDSRLATGYVLSQLVGAVLGCLPLLAWGLIGRSIAFAATYPGQGFTAAMALFGEVITTFALISVLYVFLGVRKLRAFTPATMPFLYAFMVAVEGPISGTSTNPARSLGPAFISGVWQDWWIYWVGPVIGTVLAVISCRFLTKEIKVAKLYYFKNVHRRLIATRSFSNPL